MAACGLAADWFCVLQIWVHSHSHSFCRQFIREHTAAHHHTHCVTCTRLHLFIILGANQKNNNQKPKMAKINRCLKCLFIFFNVKFAIFGCLLVLGAVKSSSYSHQLSAAGGPNLGWSWVFAIGVLGISCLGIYAGCTEKQLALKIFAGFMAVGMVIMLIFGIIIAVSANKLKANFGTVTELLANSLKEDREIRAQFDDLQSTAFCCGISSASDWGDDIPQSCLCHPGQGYGALGDFGGSGCKPRPQGARGPSQIHAQPCGDIILMAINFVLQIAMGFVFAFAVVALLGLLISLLMIHQVRRHDNAGPSIPMKGY